MKTFLIYKSAKYSDSTNFTFQFVCRPNTKLKKLCCKFKLTTEHMTRWAPLIEPTFTPIPHYSSIDFFALFKDKILKQLSTQYLKQTIETLAEPTKDRHYRLPIFDHTTKVDSWFNEISILIKGPYRLHYDYAEQYHVIQKNHASEPNYPIHSLEELYKRQYKHFPINMKHLVLFLPDFSCKVDMQRRYLTLIHYLCHHSNKFSGQCYKTIPQIQSALCISQPTLHRMIMTLESHDWLATQYTSDQRYDTKYKAPKTPTKILTLTPIFWACISGMPINGNLVKQTVIPAMQAVHNCWGMDSREYKEMTRYPFIQHIAQIQHVTKFYQTAIRESKLNVVRNESLKQLSLMRYG